jgi:hypothetical protein
MKTLRVSENRRHLVAEDGEPFFYLGDTAWELFHRLNREEADLYLEDRAKKRFTVIQAVVLAELKGLTDPNSYGDLPLHDNDPTRPNEAYFQHVDYIVDKAEALGLFIGMLPTWGDKWNRKWGAGEEIFTPENARVYGAWLATRYKGKPIIWILGGDRPVETDLHREIMAAMAQGIQDADKGERLITFHPMGGHSSAEWFHDAGWLHFNTLQSGHERNRDNAARVATDYARTPIKPCMDSEPGYEDHPSGFKKENGYLDDYDVRKFAYWAVFAGAHGHTYGCHDIWQMYAPDREPITAARTPWFEAMHLPGAGQVQHLRSLIESKPMLTRIPAQDLLASDPLAGTDHIRATRAEDGSYAFVYSASGKPFTVRMEHIAGEQAIAWWRDPRTGECHVWVGDVPTKGLREFTPPTQGEGCDWVLVLESLSEGA